MKRSGHEWIVAHRIGEHDQLCRPNPVSRGGRLCCIHDHLTHASRRRHIDTRAGRTDINRRTHDIRAGQSLGNGINQGQVAVCGPRLDQRGIPAHEVDPDSFTGAIQRLRKGQRV